MALRVKCPGCKAVNRFSDDERGSKIRCAECDASIRVPDERDDEFDDDRDERRPRRKAAKPARGLPTIAWVLIGGGIAFVVFCAAVVGLITMVMLHNPAGRPGRQGIQAHNERGKIIFQQRGFIGENDPPDPTRRAVDGRMKTHNVTLQAGKTYVLRLDSDEIDPFLRLESPTGARLAEDDDSGGELNSRIVHRTAQAGVYRVVATSFDGSFGTFQVTVWEVD